MTSKGKGAEVVATSVFTLEQLVLKKDMYWRMKLALRTVLPEAYREYSVRLSLNEEPYEIRIRDVEAQKTRVQDENQLFGGEKKKQLTRFDEAIKEIRKELQEALDTAPEIEFDATIEQLNYKDGTVVVMAIPAGSVEELNANRINLKHYKIELMR